MNGFWSFQPYIIEKKEPPKLPEKEEELQELLEKNPRLTIVEYGIGESFGTNHERALLMECPFCKSRFTGHESSGCFHSQRLPMICPICEYPNSALKKLYELILIKKTLELEGKKEEIRQKFKWTKNNLAKIPSPEEL